MDTSVRTTRRDRAVRRPDWRQYARRRPPEPPPLTARWIPPGERAVVHGHDLPDGMIYLGRAATLEPACIDPDLAVGGEGDDDLGYWPSYAAITPAQRATYLRWLSSGRRAADTPIGYVFLFFYGIERRVVRDLLADRSLRTELPLLEAEVRALLEMYGQQEAFRRYATAFLDVLELMAAPKRPSPEELAAPELDGQRWPSLMRLRRVLSAFAAEGRPVPAEWALAWAWHSRDIDWRGPSARWREFVRLFAARYAETYGDGLVLEQVKRPLRVRYEPASEALEPTVIQRRDLPEVVGRGPRRQLAVVVQAAIDDLWASDSREVSAAYPAAVAFVELAMALSGKDGLVDLVAAALQLDEAERAKLEAHVRSLTTEGDAGLSGLANSLAGLSASLRATIGELLIKAVTTRRLVLPPQVAQLLASYRRLGLDPATVPHLLHGSVSERQHRTAWTLPARDPVVVRKRRSATDDYVLPPPKPVEVRRPPKPAFRPLDTSAIEAKLAETATVSALLHDIFADEPEQPPEPVVLVAGLDAAHSALLRALAERPTWTREDFDSLAAQHGLLPAGALDVLNEAALEAADDPVLIGDGDLELDTDVLQELLP